MKRVVISFIFLLSISISAFSQNTVPAVKQAPSKKVSKAPVPEFMASAPARIDSVSVYFKVGSTKLDLNYLDNGDHLAKLFRYLDYIGPRSIKSVKIYGYTSFEGFYGSNVDVARAMNISVKRYLVSEYPIMEYKVSSSAEGEAWKALRRNVTDDTAISKASKKKIINIIDGPLEFDAKKIAFKTKLGSDEVVGDLYNYISCVYFPMLRCVKIYLEYYPEDYFGEKPR